MCVLFLDSTILYNLLVNLTTIHACTNTYIHLHSTTIAYYHTYKNTIYIIQIIHFINVEIMNAITIHLDGS